LARSHALAKLDGTCGPKGRRCVGMSIRAAYDDWSKTYDSDENITRDLDAQVVRKVFSDFECGAVLEFGCGTGKNTAFLAGVASRVLALDFSFGMIAVARESVRASNVMFEHADITKSWPVADHSQDLIACNLILQHVADLEIIFAEASRTLAHGGQMFVSELHPIKKYQGSMARYERDGESISIPAFDHQISHYIASASRNHLRLSCLNEWWHERDAEREPFTVPDPRRCGILTRLGCFG
jgi:SAM-dependent methyltransferase